MNVNLSFDMILTLTIFIPILLYSTYVYYRAKKSVSGKHFGKRYNLRFNIIGENSLYIVGLLLVNIALLSYFLLNDLLILKKIVNVYNLISIFVALIITILITRKTIKKDWG